MDRKMIKGKLPLSTLCLVTTHRCTSSCPNCGFFCSPKIKASMKVSCLNKQPGPDDTI